MATISTISFSMDSQCTLLGAEELCMTLVDRLSDSASASIDLDLSQVEEADISLLQILVSLRQTATARGCALGVQSNTYVDDLLARAGLTHWNGAPVGAPPSLLVAKV